MRDNTYILTRFTKKRTDTLTLGKPSMIKKILKNLSISNEEKDDTFSHSESILNLIEGMIIHDNTYWKYVNILTELTTLCYEDPVSFRKLFYAKKEISYEQRNKKVEQIVDRIPIVLEKYEDCRNTFIYAVAKLIFINNHDLNRKIIHILCNFVSNEEYRHHVCSVFEEIVSPAILNSVETETLDNIFKGMYYLPRDKLIAGSFRICIHKVIKLLRSSHNEHILRFLSVTMLDRESCLIAYDEGLIKVLTDQMQRRAESSFDELPASFKDVYLIVCLLCANHYKHSEILIREKLHIRFYFKKVREIVNVGLKNISKTKAIYCNIIILTLNHICKISNETLVEMCNTYHYVDLVLIGIKMEINNPYILSACLGGLLLILKNKETYKNNIQYILDNTNNIKILLPLIFGQKYHNMYNYYKDIYEDIEIYLCEIVKHTLDIVSFFFLTEINKFSIKVKKEFRNSDVNYYLMACLEKKNEEVIARLLRCIYLIPFDEYKSVELHKIFYLLHERDLTLNDQWKEIYYYCVKIYMKVIANEEVKKVVEIYHFEDTLVSILYIVNQFLLRALVLNKKNDFTLSKRIRIEQNDSIECCIDEEDIDLNMITVELLRMCSRCTELRPYMRNNSVTHYFIDILSNEDNMCNQFNIDYDIVIERSWCGNVENIFQTLMKKNITKNKKVCLRLLINLADIFSSYFYQFKVFSKSTIFNLCSLEDKHWDRKKIIGYFYQMSNSDLSDYKEQVHIFLKHYMVNFFSILNILVDGNIFTGLKKEQHETFFPGVLKYHKLKYERKICYLKLKEKEIKKKIHHTYGGKDSISGRNLLLEELQHINEKKKKLFLRLHNNNFKKTFDIHVVDDGMGCNIEDMFEIPKIVKKQKNLKCVNLLRDKIGQAIDLSSDSPFSKTNSHTSVVRHVGKSHERGAGAENIHVNSTQEEHVEMEEQKLQAFENSEPSQMPQPSKATSPEKRFAKRDIMKMENQSSAYEMSHSSDNESSESTISQENPNETVLEKISSELLKFNKEMIYERKSNNINVFLFNKRGIFVNSSKGEVNESYVLYVCLRVFYSIVINNINNENYMKVKDFLLRRNVLKTLLNILNQCSFYDFDIHSNNDTESVVLDESPIYADPPCVEWYFLTLGTDKYYLVYIPDVFEENITELKEVELIIHSEKKYIDLTRICTSKVNVNFFVFGYITFEKNTSFETYDMFICLNKYFRDEIISYCQFLSGSDFESKVDVFQDNIIINNLKNHMNVNNIIITAFAYLETKQGDNVKGEMKNLKREDNPNMYNQSYSSEIPSEEYYNDSPSTNGDAKSSSNSSCLSDDEEFNIFRRREPHSSDADASCVRTRKLVFFTLTKNHLYIFRPNFKKWIFLSPFIDEEKDDIQFYVESSTDSEEGEDEFNKREQKKKVITSEKIYLNNFLGMTTNIVNNENASFARKCAVRNAINVYYSSNRTECTNEQIVPSNVVSASMEESEGERSGTVKSDPYRRYLTANSSFLKIVHKYNNDNLSTVKFVNIYESVIALKFRIKQNESAEKKVRMIMFDDYTRELWKRSLALCLNIQMTSSYELAEQSGEGRGSRPFQGGHGPYQGGRNLVTFSRATAFAHILEIDRKEIILKNALMHVCNKWKINLKKIKKCERNGGKKLFEVNTEWITKTTCKITVVKK
ncbi:conserved Plasmodium protein, unknown function [Plasmodium ovale curtisi]|uniref:Uncharacterized protein n=1 Tax=Plasmodium ovale curtisi TaxID=864141 RepID=A0A1A8WL66_PLAOA|nr:conserved Plasmodium protein, unknown function [Plasmodium ovale curtisi]SBS92020.1 conserved Plasmodium protein, unknown function [Plasmodium ovale curtisi]